MALFGTFSDSEFQKIQAWVEKVHQELRFQIIEKSCLYSFDFAQEIPILSKKYD